MHWPRDLREFRLRCNRDCNAVSRSAETSRCLGQLRLRLLRRLGSLRTLDGEAMSKEKKSSLDRFFASLDPQNGDVEDLRTNVENRQVVPEGQRRCPICSELMHADRKQGIQVDVCHEHGVWLDKGELSALLGRTQQQAVQNAMSKAGDSGDEGGFLLGYALGKSVS